MCRSFEERNILLLSGLIQPKPRKKFSHEGKNEMNVFSEEGVRLQFTCRCRLENDLDDKDDENSDATYQFPFVEEVFILSTFLYGETPNKKKQYCSDFHERDGMLQPGIVFS